MLEQIEASRASFATAWSGFAAAAMTTGIDVTSTIAIVDEQGHQLITVGAVLVKLAPERRITPFVTGGIGLIANSGDDLSATVTGRYSFVFNGSPLTENDRVTIRYALADRDAIGVVGGGITYAVTSRSGVRIDVRAHLGQNSASTTVDLSPSVQAQQPFNVCDQLEPEPSVLQPSGGLWRPAVNAHGIADYRIRDVPRRRNRARCHLWSRLVLALLSRAGPAFGMYVLGDVQQPEVAIRP